MSAMRRLVLAAVLFVSVAIIQAAKIYSEQEGDSSISHNVCGNHWSSYATLHTKLLSGDLHGGFVTFKPDPWRGYANQLLGISSAFAVALLTKRAFLIDDDFLGHAFSSRHIRWDILASGSKTSSTTNPNMSKIHSWQWHSLKDCEAEGRLKVEAASWDLDAMLRDYGNVEISTNVAWWPWLFNNPRYSKEVASWGLRSEADFFACSMHYLLNPREIMREALQPLLEKMRGHVTVGLQLRMNPETAQIRVEDWRRTVECGKQILRKQGIDPDSKNSVRWIIATDLPAVVDSLRADLGEDALVWWDAEQDDGTGRAGLTLSRDEWDAQQLKRAVDHYALSLANVSVISFASTFGLTAATMHPGAARHYAFGRHYHQSWVPPRCEASPCGGPNNATCFGKAFGYFDLCSHDLVYGHGEQFLAAAAERNPRCDDETLLLESDSVDGTSVGDMLSAGSEDKDVVRGEARVGHDAVAVT